MLNNTHAFYGSGNGEAKMDIVTLHRIIKEEELSGANIYPSDYPHQNRVVMTTDGSKWTALHLLILKNNILFGRKGLI